jgi:hypothetical protein
MDRPLETLPTSGVYERDVVHRSDSGSRLRGDNGMRP